MIYLVIFLLSSAVASYLINNILLTFSSNLGIHNTEGNVSRVRWESSSKPTLGGFSFYLVFLIASFSSLFIFDTETILNSDFKGLLIIGTLGFFIGLVDDTYDTNALLKFLAQVGCGVLMILMGVQIELFQNQLLNWGLTIFWSVGIMNSINMLDNMDGVTGSISAVILIITTFLMIKYGVDYSIYGILCMAVTGSILGFLVLNWSPSKLYMGDSGSQFLGAFLAYMGIKFLWNIQSIEGYAVTSLQLIIPIMVFIVPIMDTSFASLARILKGKSPFVGGRDHLTHHLTFLGISQSMVPIVLSTLGFLSGLVAIFSTRFLHEWHHWYTVVYSTYIIITFVVFYSLYKKGERISELKDKLEKHREKMRIIHGKKPTTKIEPSLIKN